jgi:hypothetical protein
MKLFNIKVLFKDYSVLEWTMVGISEEVIARDTNFKPRFHLKVALTLLAASWGCIWLIPFSLITNGVQNSCKSATGGTCRGDQTGNSQDNQRLYQNLAEETVAHSQKRQRRGDWPRTQPRPLNDYKMALRVEWSDAKKISGQIQFLMP